MSSYYRIYTTMTFRAVRCAIVGSLLFEPIHYASSHPCYSLWGRKKTIRKIPVDSADKRKWVSHLSTNRLRKIIDFGKSLYLLASSFHFLMDSQNVLSRPWLSVVWSISCFHTHSSLWLYSNRMPVKNKGRTDKTLHVFLQHKNKVYLFARSLKVRGFVLFSPPALGFLCGLSQYGFCQF